MFGNGRGRGMGRRFRDVLAEMGGRGRNGGTAEGPGGNCKCPNCGNTVKHITGTPCTDQSCPKCGTKMVRD